MIAACQNRVKMVDNAVILEEDTIAPASHIFSEETVIVSYTALCIMFNIFSLTLTYNKCNTTNDYICEAQ